MNFLCQVKCIVVSLLPLFDRDPLTPIATTRQFLI
jgi:hypothetical protein